MKNLVLPLLILLTAFGVSAQAPEGFNYQAVARDNSGELLKNKNITVKMTVLSGQSASKKVYEETHVVTTNNLGYFNVVVGQGSTSDDFSAISWGSDPHHLKVEIDQGSGFAVMGTVQLQSVPFALHSKKAESVDNVSTDNISDISSTGAASGSVLKWNGTSWVPGTDENTGTTYNAGTGIDVAGGTISAKSDDALWNANKLSGNKISTTTPNNGQVLKWDGSEWKPGDLGGVYHPGNGLTLSNDTFKANSNSALWNANKLHGISIDNGMPSKDQVLQYNGSKWSFGTLSGSSVWTKKSDKVYVKDVNVGVNTDNPTTRFMVWDSITNTASGLWIMAEHALYGGTSSGGQYVGSRSIVFGRGGAFSYGSINVATGDIHSGGEGIGSYALSSTDGQSSIAVYGSSSNANTYNVGAFLSARSSSTSSSGVNYGVFAVADSGATNYAGFFSGDVSYTGSLSQASDAKLKYNVNDLTNATDIIKKLNPKTYLYKQDGEYGWLNLAEGKQFGFIAQEMEEVLPNLVSKQVQMKGPGEKDGMEYKGVNYVALIPVLTQALKEQQEHIESLEKRIQELEASHE